MMDRNVTDVLVIKMLIIRVCCMNIAYVCRAIRMCCHCKNA